MRDARIPLSTGHPELASWAGSKLRLVVLNQMDRVSPGERARWASHFAAAANVKVVFTNAREGEGVARLARLATAVSAGLTAGRAAKGLRPRPVRAAVVGFPNVGKSALINRLLGRATCASAARPGVTRHLQWVSLGADSDLMLLDAPGVLPARLADQQAALRLAVCNDIGEASYTPSRVAAAFIDGLLRLPEAGGARGLRCGALAARYRLDPREFGGRGGEDYVEALAQRDGAAGDTERAARRVLKDYQEGRLGCFGLEAPPPPPAAAVRRVEEGVVLGRAPPQQQPKDGPAAAPDPARLSAWLPDGPSRRVVRLAAKADDGL